MDDDELRAAAQPATVVPRNQAHLEEILTALERLDPVETQSLLSFQLSALGAVRFSRQIAKPLVYEIGERWSRGEISVAAEHMATSVLRTMFGAALQPTAATALGPRIVFATPPGERHELGLQMAALTAMGAGAQAIYLGADLPADELTRAVERTRASGVGLSLVTLERATAEQFLNEIAGTLPAHVRVWIGGRISTQVEMPARFDGVESLEDFERRIALTEYEPVSVGKR
jgi:methanogenic corrinoid protein MtbC1